MSEILYAVYPGNVTLYDGTVKSWTAADLAAAYGVQDTPYLTVNNPAQIPKGMDYFKYIHLVPRADDIYENIMYTAEDDGEEVAYRPDFDGSRKYIQETNPRTIDEDVVQDMAERDKKGIFQ